MIRSRQGDGKFVCVGLDSDQAKLPEVLRFSGRAPSAVYAFNANIIDATRDRPLAYKPNIAFYEELGADGWQTLKLTIERIKKNAPDVPIILDCKRGDIGNTNKGYVAAAFDYFGVDAVTVSPYLGKEALLPFLDRKDKGIIALCKTSNKGSGEFQDMHVSVPSGETFAGRYVHTSASVPLYQFVAHRIAKYWNDNGNCGIVVGATYPADMAEVRKIVGPGMQILAPGIGTQGGDLEATLEAGLDEDGFGLIVNSSSAIIFASKLEDYAVAAEKATNALDARIRTHLGLEAAHA